MISFVLALALSQPMNLNQQPIIVKDEGVTQGTVRASTVNCVGAGVACTQSGSTMTVTVTGGGGGGGGNYLTDAVTFAGKSDTTRTVTAAWATSSSYIVCSAADEEGSVENLAVTVISRAAGSFVVRAYVPQGTHTGALPIYCTGL